MFLLPERFQGFAYSKFQSVPGKLLWDHWLFLASGSLHFDSVSLAFSLLSQLEFSGDGSSVYFVLRWCIINRILTEYTVRCSCVYMCNVQARVMSTPLPFIIYRFLGVSKVLCVGIICPRHCLGDPGCGGFPPPGFL